MIGDDNRNVSDVAIDKILQIWTKNFHNEASSTLQNSDYVRMFSISKEGAEAKVYYEMSSLNHSFVHELPDIKCMCKKAFRQLALEKLLSAHLCRNQAVERKISY